MEKNYKIPNGWSLSTILEIIPVDGIFVDGDWIETKDQDPNGEVRLIQLADIGEGYFKDKSERFLTLDTAYRLNCTFLKEGDILVARMPEPIGRACIFPLKGTKKYITAVDVAIIRTGKNCVFNKYLMHILNSPKNRTEIERLQKGTTRKRISRSNLATIKLPIAPLNEQHRIVDKIEELYSELNNGKENLKKSQQQLKVYRQSLLKTAFEGKLTEEWRKEQSKLKTPQELIDKINLYRKERYEIGLKNFEEGKTKTKPKKPENFEPLSNEIIKKLFRLPEGWCWVKVSSLGQTETGTTPSKKISEYYGNKFPFYKPTELDEGYNVRNANEFLSDEGMKKARFLPENSILVTSIGATIGKTGIIRKAGASNQQINAIIAYEINNPNFIYFQCIGNYFQDQIKSNSVATTLPILNKLKFIELYFAICTREEQNVIVKEIESKFSICDNLDKTIGKSLYELESLRQSILHKAFEGKIVPQDPNDEPASKLLERIKKEREEYLKNQKLKPKKRKKDMIEELKTILQILQVNKKPVHAKTLWKSSVHKDDIDAFYAQLKEHIENGKIVEIERQGKDSFLKLVEEK